MAEFTPDRKVRVLFVEYGNEQLCLFSQLRPLLQYKVGDRVDAKYVIDNNWYRGKIVHFDAELKEYKVQFEKTLAEQVCDRSFIRPLPEVVDQEVEQEIVRQSMAPGRVGLETSTDSGNLSASERVRKRLMEKERKLNSTASDDNDWSRDEDILEALGMTEADKPRRNGKGSTQQQQKQQQAVDEDEDLGSFVNVLTPDAEQKNRTRTTVNSKVRTKTAAVAIDTSKPIDVNALLYSSDEEGPREPEPEEPKPAPVVTKKTSAATVSKVVPPKKSVPDVVAAVPPKQKTTVTQQRFSEQGPVANDVLAPSDDPFADDDDGGGNDEQDGDDDDDDDDGALADAYLRQKAERVAAETAEEKKRLDRERVEETRKQKERVERERLEEERAQNAKREQEKAKLAEKHEAEAREQAKLREMMFNQQANDAAEEEWMSGEECEAQWAEDGEWYRALIIGMDEEGGYVVEFIEYGNVQEGTPLDMMRRLPAAEREQATPADDDSAARKGSPNNTKKSSGSSERDAQVGSSSSQDNDEEDDYERMFGSPRFCCFFSLLLNFRPSFA
jgi:hypothetical protein